MRLQLCSWPEVEAYLCKSRGIIVPIGSTEQHGPSGLIGTDAICPETVAIEVGKRHGILIAPTISIGMAQHHLAFPGSIAFRPSTLMAVVVDVVTSLGGQGFERILFLNGHGGNIPTVNAAFSEVYAEYSMGRRQGTSPKCKMVNWFTGPNAMALGQEFYGDAEGSHATPSEVSLSYFAYPEAVKDVPLEPKRANVGTIYDAADFRKQFPDGRCGSEPQLANVEDGKRLFEASIEDTLEIYHTFLAS